MYYSAPYKSPKQKKDEYFQNVLSSISDDTNLSEDYLNRTRSIFNALLDSFPTAKELNKNLSEQEIEDLKAIQDFTNKIILVMVKKFNNTLFTIVNKISENRPILNFLTEESINVLIEHEDFKFVDENKNFLNYYFFKHNAIQDGVTKKVGEILNIKYNDPIFTEEQLCKIIEKSDVNSLDESFDNALYNLVLNYDENSNIILTEKLLLSLISKTNLAYTAKDRRSIFINLFNNESIKLSENVIDFIIKKGLEENPKELALAVFFNKNNENMFNEKQIDVVINYLKNNDSAKRTVLDFMFENKINKNILFNNTYDFLINNSKVKDSKKNNLFHNLVIQKMEMPNEIFNKFVEANIYEINGGGSNIFSFLLKQLNGEYKIKDEILDRFINELDLNLNNQQSGGGLNTVVCYLMHQKSAGINLNEKQFDLFIEKINPQIKDYDEYNVLHNIFHHMKINNYRLSSKQLFKLLENIDINDKTTNDKTLGHFYVMNESKGLPEDFLHHIFENINPLIQNDLGQNFVECYFGKKINYANKNNGNVSLDDKFIAQVLNKHKISGLRNWIQEVVNKNVNPASNLLHIEPNFFKGLLNQISLGDFFVNMSTRPFHIDEKNTFNLKHLIENQKKSLLKNSVNLPFALVCLQNIIENNSILFGLKENTEIFKEKFAQSDIKDIYITTNIYEDSSKHEIKKISYVDYFLGENKKIDEEIWSIALSKLDSFKDWTPAQLALFINYYDNNTCIKKEDLSKVLNSVNPNIINTEIIDICIKNNIYNLLPPKILNNLEIAHELVKNKKENFIALGTVIKNELKLTEENSFEVLSNVLKKQNKVIALLHKNKNKKLQEEIDRKVIKEITSSINNKSNFIELIDNFSKVNEELQRIKKNIEEIKEMEEENISNINKDILNKKISLVEDLVKSNNLDYNQIKIAADKIETIKEETKEGLLLKVKAEASLIKYIKKM